MLRSERIREANLLEVVRRAFIFETAAFVLFCLGDRRLQLLQPKEVIGRSISFCEA